jgi:hypothetical protein
MAQPTDTDNQQMIQRVIELTGIRDFRKLTVEQVAKIMTIGWRTKARRGSYQGCSRSL